MISNAEEDMHADAEGAAIPILESLRVGKADILGDAHTYVDFARFLGLQYMRTPTIAMRVKDTLKDMPGLNPQAVWGVLRTIYATNIGKGIFQSRKSTRITFLECNPPSELITADQPIINLGGVEHLELYYPVTPVRAMLLRADGPNPGVATTKINGEEAARYNKRILEASMRQIFAACNDTLRRTSA